MAYTGTDVATEAAVLLNDSAQTTFTNTVLLPYIKRAYREVAKRLRLSGSPLMLKISSAIDIAALAKTVSSPPTDMLRPVKLWERPDGGNDDDWIEMTFKTILPQGEEGQTLKYWTWQEDAIAFVGCTTAREVKIQYKRVLPALSAIGDNILIGDGQAALAALTAAYAAKYILQNDSRYEGLMVIFQEDLADLVGESVQGQQLATARPRGYRPKAFRRL